MQNEISKAAEKLGISVTEAQSKFESICEENKVSTDSPLAKGLWRSYASQQIRMIQTEKTDGKKGKKGFGDDAFGFFISLEEPRDMMAYNRKRAIDEWNRDPFNAHQNGLVATAEKNAEGNYVVSRFFNGEEQTRTMGKLAEGAEYLEDGSIIIPLDSQQRYQNGGENANYGKPLAKELMRRSGVFIGKVGDDTDYNKYYFSYKNEGGIKFSPSTFEWVHMSVIKDSNRDGYIYGYSMKTLGSLVMNADVDPEGDIYRDVSSINVFDKASELVAENIASLTLLDAKHLELRENAAVDRFVMTMGTVCNMNMTPTSNGNRILNLTDLNADFDYDTDGMTTCWIPEHIDIDFGIGSEVVVVGRTSQREGEDGYEPATINLSGLYVTERKGQVEEIGDAQEEDLDWF
tara:strand:- start:338 stop:1549 length:1212 start_codon:yes stop_codon:yes gene_type:complete